MASKRPTLLVSSAVYGFEELLDRLYAILDGLGYEVWMSHKGTVPVNSLLTALDNCRQAVAECDLFLGIIPRLLQPESLFSGDVRPYYQSVVGRHNAGNAEATLRI